MADQRWTLCRGCMKPIAVNIIKRDGSDGAGWWYSCPSPCNSNDDDGIHREREAGTGPVDWDRDVPPPDPLVVLAAIVGPIVERTGREAVGIALGFIAAPPAPEPADPNQLPLPLGAS